jgi:hypothetical protein
MSCVAYDPTFHKVRYLAGTGAGRIPVERRGQVIAEWSRRIRITIWRSWIGETSVLGHGGNDLNPQFPASYQIATTSGVTHCGLYETLCLK